MNRTRFAGAFALILMVSAVASSQTVDSAFMAGMRWRPIGPANMSGRVTDVEGLPSPSRTFYVVSVAGGVFKTTNGGTTFRPLFQSERIASLGDLAIAPSDSMQLWLGTGEEDSRNSHSPGGGIYKSTDAGMTWQLMGLEKTEHIGRIIVHPTNPNIVYVAAVGAAWRSNPERGLYKTEDGGTTWKLIKFISDKAGFVDMVMDPRNPDVLFASSWERVRGPYFLRSGGPGSALWKTTDGGRSWTEVKGGGFPATNKGRIGIAIAASNPQVMYALVEAEPPADKPWRSNPPGTPNNNCRNVGAGGCGLHRSTDGGATWEWMNGNNVRPFYYSQVRVDIKNPDRVYWSSTPVNYSTDGGKTIGATTVALHVDHHAMWLDPADEDHFIVGNDGGVGQTWDKGGSYEFINTFPLGQFYNISHDMRIPYRVCGGLQDNGSWCGPSRKAGNNAMITNHDWFTFNGGDGFVTQQDPRHWNIIYGESQGGNMSRFDLLTGVRTPLRKPSWLDAYRAAEDSILIERGDTATPVTPPLQQRLAALRARQLTDSVSLSLRWNWNTPFILSPHNPDFFYAGANRVMKSTNRGEDMTPISPDLTYNDSAKVYISTRITGGVTKDTTGAETYGTIVSLAESPIRAGTLHAGTDDGRVWSTVDDGRTWNEHTRAFARLVPQGTYVSRIEPSRANAARFYITFDNHRNGDFTPYVFATDDGGKSFRSIASNLPRGAPDFVHVIREDPVNPNLLYVGTDVGAYVSLDRGASWQKFMNGLPTTPVHDLKIHPR
ncbi:MAG: WD40/YVTN/BNR-like repeat-containing protein, partial [Gemmatimonadota bacterium]